MSDKLREACETAAKKIAASIYVESTADIIEAAVRPAVEEYVSRFYREHRAGRILGCYKKGLRDAQK